MDPLVSQLAALMHYEHEQSRNKEKAPVKFDDLDKKKKDSWIKRSSDVLSAIDKCNYKLVDKRAIVTQEEHQKDVDKIATIIKEFVSKIQFKKLNEAIHFPSEELAHRIYE